MSDYMVEHFLHAERIINNHLVKDHSFTTEWVFKLQNIMLLSFNRKCAWCKQSSITIPNLLLCRLLSVLKQLVAPIKSLASVQYKPHITLTHTIPVHSREYLSQLQHLYITCYNDLFYAHRIYPLLLYLSLYILNKINITLWNSKIAY